MLQSTEAIIKSYTYYISGHAKSMRTALFRASMTLGMVVLEIKVKLLIQRDKMSLCLISPN